MILWCILPTFQSRKQIRAGVIISILQLMEPRWRKISAFRCIAQLARQNQTRGDVPVPSVPPFCRRGRPGLRAILRYRMFWVANGICSDLRNTFVSPSTNYWKKDHRYHWSRSPSLSRALEWVLYLCRFLAHSFVRRTASSRSPAEETEAWRDGVNCQ